MAQGKSLEGGNQNGLAVFRRLAGSTFSGQERPAASQGPLRRDENHQLYAAGPMGLTPLSVVGSGSLPVTCQRDLVQVPVAQAVRHGMGVIQLVRLAESLAVVLAVVAVLVVVACGPFALADYSQTTPR